MEKTISSFLSIVLLIVLLIGCKNKNASEAHLQERVKAFYDLLKHERFENSWDYLMEVSKKSWIKDRWVMFWLGVSKKSKMLDYHLGPMRIEKNNKSTSARVKVVLKVLDLSSNEIYSSDHESEWAFENGEWFRFEDI